jgi:hypothetical protein
VDGPLDLDQFQVLAAGRLEGPRLALRAGIIGASHFLALRAGQGAPLHEVFACGAVRVEAPAARLRQLAVHELSESGTAFETDGLSYRFRSWSVAAREAAERLSYLDARVAEAPAQSQEIGLAYTFPGTQPGTRQAALSPRTVLWARIDTDAASVRVETAHCYPKEETIVFSRTDARVKP